MDISSQEIEAIVKQVLSGMGSTPTASPSAAAPRCSACGEPVRRDGTRIRYGEPFCPDCLPF